MSKRKKKRYGDGFAYREFPAAYVYDPRFFPGGVSGFPGGPGGFPGGPGGFPGGPGSFPGGPGGFPGGPAQAPTTPPPNYIPQKPLTTGLQPLAVSAPSLRPCLFRFTYIWLQGGGSFWFYPVFLDRRTVAGFRWNGFSWSYAGLDLRRIEFFQCT